MKAVKIERVVQETPDITTLYFPRVGEANPGSTSWSGSPASTRYP